MSEKRTNLEIITPTVEEAVAKGLEDLGLPESAVEVDVLDPGSRGLFGLGSRQARVRLTLKGEASDAPAAAVVRIPAEPPAPVAAPVVAPVEVEEPAAIAPGEGPVEMVEDFEEEIVEDLSDEFAEDPVDSFIEDRVASIPVEAPPSSAPVDLTPEQQAALDTARSTVAELLDKMKVRATVTARYGEADDDRSRTPLIVDVRGDDLSILIGPKAETLNALQYISSLIVSKELGHTLPLIVDVEGFRYRREQQVRQLARRMAEQAIKTGKRQVLEPMPASERRLIHIELRNHPQVTTESIGEEPRRKVTIVPKEGASTGA